ncbi:MAG: CapA family protein [Acidobacteriia bacterium]|nr:CapA family protein [Terriglobia bacterium]
MPAPAPVQPLHILWLGDIMMEVPWRQPPVSPPKLFDGVRESLAGRDLVIANLESSLTNWPDVTPYKDKALIAAGKDVVSRTTSPLAAEAVAGAGIQVVGLANNHTMDYTEHGLLETFERLEAAGVHYTGAGKNIAAAEDALILEMKGRRVGILSFSDVVPRFSWAEAARPGIASAKEVDRVVEAVRRARPRVDILIVLFHWGVQFDREPSPRQEFLARETQKAGADLILGAHPHVLQGIACLGAVPVVYSAGNFVFPVSGFYTRRSAIFEFEFPAQGAPSVRLIPAMIDDLGAPQIAASGPREDILAEMARLSQPLGLTLENGSGSCRVEAAPAALPVPEKPQPAIPDRQP